MKRLFALMALLLMQACKPAKKCDLAIINASVFDTRKGMVIAHQSILVNADTIAEVTDSNNPVNAGKTIDAGGKLVTPGMIDAHIHPTHFFGDYDAAPKYLAKDSLNFLRKKFSDNYLPFGVTAVMIMGQPETWLGPVLNWSAHPSPNYTDIYTVGGALISKETRKPYICHTTVVSPEAARQKILAYHRMGIRHIKLYWRLRRPEFEAAFKTADSLGMRVYGHIDEGIMNMDTTLRIGLINYEHIFTIIHSLPWSESDGNAFVAWMDRFYGKEKWQTLPFWEVTLNEVRWCVDYMPDRIDALIGRLAKHHATFSTTIHLPGEKFGLTYFSNPGNRPDTGVSKERVQRNRDNFKGLMVLVKKVYDSGIKIRIGTDVPNGGKAVLSEQLLLAQYGFTIRAIIQMATINGAAALGMTNKYGAIEPGKKADLIIYDQNPMENYRNFLSKRTVIKDGIVRF
jgi:hypothetical protein